MKKAEIKKQFLNQVEKLLIPKGFEKKKTDEGFEYILKTDEGFRVILPIINDYASTFYLSLALGLRINKISEIITLFSNISEEHRSESPTLNFGFSDLIEYPDDRIKVESSDELEQALNLFNQTLENEAMIFFERFQTVEDWDHELNRENRLKDLYVTCFFRNSTFFCFKN